MTIKITGWRLVGGPGHMMGTQLCPYGLVDVAVASEYELASAIITREGGDDFSEICKVYLNRLDKQGWDPSTSKDWGRVAYNAAKETLLEQKQ